LLVVIARPPASAPVLETVYLPSGTFWKNSLGPLAGLVGSTAATAAVVSFGHIETLALSHGQPLAAARLLPVSVDGLLTAASLLFLDAAGSGRKAPTLARYMLALGVAATVAANVAYGYRFGPLGMAVSAWPAVAFIGSVELVMGMVREGRRPRVAEAVEGVAFVAAESPTTTGTVDLVGR